MLAVKAPKVAQRGDTCGLCKTISSALYHTQAQLDRIVT